MMERCRMKNKTTEEKIKELLLRTEAEALIITDPFNIRYLSGFSGGEGALFLTEGERILITDSRYTESAEKESSFTVIEENRSHNRMEIFRECLEKSGAASVGYEDQSLRCSEFHRMREALPEMMSWIPLEDRVDRTRRIKTEEEIRLIARAEAIGDAAFTEILKILRPGMTELEAAAELEYQMRKAGAGGFSFDTIMASGRNSSMPHAVPSEKILEEGDFITMDFGCTWQGYCSDMTRTVVLGAADKKQREIYQTVLDAQEAALSVIRAGLTGAEVDRAARELITEAGYGECFGHGLGHSVGLFIHEEPRLSPSGLDILEPGMLETVEPGIYVPGFGGVRIEDLVVVTEEGCRNLTSSPKYLIEL